MTTATKMRLRRIDDVLGLADSMLLDLAEDLGRGPLTVSMRPVRRALDEVRQRIDEATLPGDEPPYPIPEAAGNMFRSLDRPPTLCSQCGRYWPPAGRHVCARCDPLPPEPLPSLSEEARREQEKTLRAIQGVPQNDYGRSDR